jgi:hypothetical protein
MFMLLAEPALPPAADIRQKADEVVSRSYYDLADTAGGDPVPLWMRMMRWLARPFEWLFKSMEGWPDWLRWLIVIVCIVLLIALVSHIAYTLVRAIRGPVARVQRRYDPAHIEIDPASLERDAEQAVRMGDYIGAVRLLFRAALRRIEVAEKKKLRPGFTNRELLRRYRSTALFGPLERFVETIDNKWYGGEPCLQEDYLVCRTEHARIRDYAKEVRTANDA